MTTNPIHPEVTKWLDARSWHPEARRTLLREFGSTLYEEQPQKLKEIKEPDVIFIFPSWFRVIPGWMAESNQFAYQRGWLPKHNGKAILEDGTKADIWGGSLCQVNKRYEYLALKFDREIKTNE